MKPKILFIVNIDWFFVSHRLPIALEAIKQGYEVHLACSVTDKLEYLTSHSIIVHDLPVSRSGKKILTELKTLLSIYKIIKEVKPNIVHSVTIKPVIYAGLLNRFSSISNVSSISGLGYVFSSATLKAKILRFFVVIMYKCAIRKRTDKIIFQNIHDYNILLNYNIFLPENSVLIRGAGVDLEQYQFFPEETKDVAKVIMVSRLLYDKGVAEFVASAKQLKARGVDAEFVLVGDIDLENPNSVTQEDFDKWLGEENVSLLGYRSDISSLFRKSSIVVLPSYYGEGLPKVLIEAAACGRPVVTTDHPGCRDAILVDETGLLIEIKSVDSLANAIECLLEDDELRSSMGVKGRALAEAEYDIKKVVQTHLKIYESSLSHHTIYSKGR